MGTEHESPAEDLHETRRDETAEGETPQKDETPDEKDTGNENEMKEPEVPEDVKDAATQHGPASKIVVTHDRETGRHAVASQHKDGHMHQSVRKDAKSAHASAKHLGMPQQTQPDVDDLSHLLG